MHDHTGKFGRAIDGVNTPETQVADNDYAVGLLVEAVAKSRYANDTLIFVIEDDAQDGPDHVDAQRSVAFVAGPYVRQHALVSAHYSTVNMLRTIEDVLGIDHLSLNDAYQHPMSEVFDLAQRDWQFKATPSPFLASTQLPVQQPVATLLRQPTHDAAWWEAQMEDMDFSVEDHLDVARYNQILWNGLRGNQPYPQRRSGADLRSGRNSLLAVGADQ